MNCAELEELICDYVDGTLTAEWRKQHPDAEPASELLKRILIERRKRWEKDQLRKYADAGRQPPANWKAKYKEPVAPDVSDLPELDSHSRCHCYWLAQGGTTPVMRAYAISCPMCSLA